MNYDDLADARGISRESAIRMARRKRWPRKAMNDGSVMLAVPVTALVREERPHTQDARPDARDDNLSRTINALQDALALLREQIGQSDRTIADLRAERDRLLARISELEAERIRRPLLARLFGAIGQKGPKSIRFGR